MLTVYADYFRKRLQELDQPGSLDKFIKDLTPEYWRDDARLFLTLNLIGMVVAPYVQAHPSGSPKLGELLPVLEKDVEAIRRRADRFAAERGRSYVSATSVSMALGELAPDLATTSLQIWGPGEPDPAPQSAPA